MSDISILKKEEAQKRRKKALDNRKAISFLTHTFDINDYFEHHLFDKSTEIAPKAELIWSETTPTPPSELQPKIVSTSSIAPVIANFADSVLSKQRLKKGYFPMLGIECSFNTEPEEVKEVSFPESHTHIKWDKDFETKISLHKLGEKPKEKDKSSEKTTESTGYNQPSPTSQASPIHDSLDELLSLSAFNTLSPLEGVGVEDAGLKEPELPASDGNAGDTSLNSALTEFDACPAVPEICQIFPALPVVSVKETNNEILPERIEHDDSNNTMCTVPDISTVEAACSNIMLLKNDSVPEIPKEKNIVENNSKPAELDRLIDLNLDFAANFIQDYKLNEAPIEKVPVNLTSVKEEKPTNQRMQIEFNHQTLTKPFERCTYKSEEIAPVNNFNANSANVSNEQFLTYLKSLIFLTVDTKKSAFIVLEEFSKEYLLLENGILVGKTSGFKINDLIDNTYAYYCNLVTSQKLTCTQDVKDKQIISEICQIIAGASAKQDTIAEYLKRYDLKTFSFNVIYYLLRNQNHVPDIVFQTLILHLLMKIRDKLLGSGDHSIEPDGGKAFPMGLKKNPELLKRDNEVVMPECGSKFPESANMHQKVVSSEQPSMYVLSLAKSFGSSFMNATNMICHSQKMLKQIQADSSLVGILKEVVLLSPKDFSSFTSIIGVTETVKYLSMYRETFQGLLKDKGVSPEQYLANSLHVICGYILNFLCGNSEMAIIYKNTQMANLVQNTAISSMGSKNGHLDMGYNNYPPTTNTPKISNAVNRQQEQLSLRKQYIPEQACPSAILPPNRVSMLQNVVLNQMQTQNQNINSLPRTSNVPYNRKREYPNGQPTLYGSPNSNFERMLHPRSTQNVPGIVSGYHDQAEFRGQYEFTDNDFKGMESKYENIIRDKPTSMNQPYSTSGYPVNLSQHDSVYSREYMAQNIEPVQARSNIYNSLNQPPVNSIPPLTNLTIPGNQHMNPYFDPHLNNPELKLKRKIVRKNHLLRKWKMNRMIEVRRICSLEKKIMTKSHHTNLSLNFVSPKPEKIMAKLENFLKDPISLQNGYLLLKNVLETTRDKHKVEFLTSFFKDTSTFVFRTNQSIPVNCGPAMAERIWLCFLQEQHDLLMCYLRVNVTQLDISSIFQLMCVCSKLVVMTEGSVKFQCDMLSYSRRVVKFAILKFGKYHTMLDLLYLTAMYKYLAISKIFKMRLYIKLSKIAEEMRYSTMRFMNFHKDMIRNKSIDLLNIMCIWGKHATLMADPKGKQLRMFLSRTFLPINEETDMVTLTHFLNLIKDVKLQELQ